MAIIKCPECGHDVSDKAPVCLYCGVEIAGKYIARPVAPQRPTRPVTPQPTVVPTEPVQPAQPVTPQPRVQQETTAHIPAQPVVQADAQQSASRPQPNNGAPRPKAQTGTSIYDNGGGGVYGPNGSRSSGDKPKKSHAVIYLILFLIVVIAGVVLYNVFSGGAPSADQEASAYKFAMETTDAKAMQKYLEEYSSAPREHRDSVQARMTSISKLQREWDNVYSSNSRSAFEEYAKNNPDSPYRNEALHKVDSIDWARALREGSTESYDAYLREHPDGEHTAEARSKSANPGVDAAAQSEVTTPAEATAVVAELPVTPDEKERVDNASTYFFQAINSHSAAKINTKVPQPMTRFLDKTNATSADVLAFSQNLLSNGVTNFNWRIDHNSFVVKKHDLGNGNFEYSSDFKASLNKATAAGNQQQDYVVTVKVKQGRVTYLTMKKAQ